MRRQLRARRRGVSLELRERAGRRVAEHVLALSAVREARRVALYAALPDEVPTRPLFDALSATGCERLLPRIAGDALVFARVEDWSGLRADRHGILSPAAESPERRPGVGDVVLLPGVAFDAAGHRLGRGGGYYDRAFAGSGDGPLLVGLAFELQLVPRVPHDSQDRAVDAIVTEQGVIWPGGRRTP